MKRALAIAGLMIIPPSAFGAGDVGFTIIEQKTIRKENPPSTMYRGHIVDRLADGTWAVWDGKGNVWQFPTEAEAKKFVRSR